MVEIYIYLFVMLKNMNVNKKNKKKPSLWTWAERLPATNSNVLAYAITTIQMTTIARDTILAIDVLFTDTTFCRLYVTSNDQDETVESQNLYKQVRKHQTFHTQERKTR